MAFKNDQRPTITVAAFEVRPLSDGQHNVFLVDLEKVQQIKFYVILKFESEI